MIQWTHGAARPRLLLAALTVAAGPLHAVLTYPGCPDLASSHFRVVNLVARVASHNPLVLNTGLVEPVSIWVHTDGRVYWTERTNTGSTTGTGATSAVGRLRVFNPNGNTIRTVASFNVSTAANSQVTNNSPEYGLRSFAMDPDFGQNKYAYVIYNPRTTASGRGVDTMYLSRFTMPTLDSLDLASEKRLIKMPWTPGICCHQGGAMDWDAAGNLYFSTGNNTENIDNYAPMHDSLFANASGAAKDRATRDNQARVANTMDWRGKIFRIKPDGSEKGYSIPAGNYRARYHELGGAWVADQDTNKILPEIYAFGMRNPYTLSVDKATGWVSWGDVGPDQGSNPSASRGPSGRDEFNMIKAPGFAGWPYFVGDNRGYNMWNPATKSYSLPVQKPDSVFNNSPHNTGVARLTPAIPAILPESKVPADNAWNLGTGSGTSATTGPIYRYNGASSSTVKMPPHLDGKWLVAEWAKDWFKVVTLNPAGTAVTAIEDFPLGVSASGLLDVKVGPDGAIYLMHYGKSYFGSTDATRISRVEYTGSCLPVSVHSVAAGQRDFLRPGGVLFAPGTGRLAWPAGVTRVEAYDLGGRRVFTAVRAGEADVAVPEGIGANVLRVRFLP